jgi:hypothetical protein
MGCNPVFSSSFISDGKYNEPLPPNPVPWRFTLHRVEEFGNCVVVVVEYPDAKNYEGKKVLVYRNTTAHQIQKTRVLDPHFSEKGLTPFARFAPTKEGIECAIQMARLWADRNGG